MAIQPTATTPPSDWWWSLHLDQTPPLLASTIENGTNILKWVMEEAGNGVFGWVVKTRTKMVAPILWVAIWGCTAMSMMLFVEAVFLATVSLYVKLFCWNAQKRYKWEPLIPVVDNVKDDEEGGGNVLAAEAYPMVLIQIPMYNEKEVYKLSIGAACALTWPPDRIIIQVLDDSTDPHIKELVELECRGWASKGLQIKYEVRDNRRGYKAGALKEGMVQSYAEKCEFVAIFDADFQPSSDFLMQTIPFLMSNSDVALIQARWEFVNSDQCLLTRIQKMTLDYHFKVEQEAGSSAFAFFGFNGTAGVWRISALNEAGGWKDRTTVEDMDLAVRATLKGWKFVYVGSTKVKSELPSNFKAYRNQQQRWACGAANLFRKMAKEIIVAKEVSFFKKLYVFYSFFFLRKVVAHAVSCVFYCMVIPIAVFVPEVQIPPWALYYIPTTITLLHAMRNPSTIHLLAIWIVFENVMSLHRLRATMIGLFEARGVEEWVVTDKLGEALLVRPDRQIPEKTSRFKDRVYIPEICFGIFLSICAIYNLTYARDFYYVYIFLEATAFFIVGFGYVGTFVSSS